MRLLLALNVRKHQKSQKMMDLRLDASKLTASKEYHHIEHVERCVIPMLFSIIFDFTNYFKLSAECTY
jgi:hypothetical protein